MKRFLLLTIVMSGVALAAFAQSPSVGVDSFQAPSDPRWKPIAVEDVKAAYRLLRDNHPGAAAQLHDTAFVRRLSSAYALSMSRAASVESYQGYVAVLAGFATDMGDKHIWSRPTFVVSYPKWPEIIVSKLGSSWVVTYAEAAQSALRGASLVSCDGEAVQDLARKNLGGFRAVWGVGAQQVQYAPWLLVDEGNPFIRRPSVCVFEHDGREQTVTLGWARIKREDLLPRLKVAGGAGAAGFGVRRVADGYWTSLQDLESAKAMEVVKAVEQQKASLREARFVVLDLRGNRGGSSDVGRQIAASLLGEMAVNARLAPVSVSDCGSAEVWRATTGNLAQLEHFQGMPFVTQGSAETRKVFADLIGQVRAALAHGQEFSGPIDCPATARSSAPTLPPSLLKGRLILLTDNLCFSSCLAVTQDFRTLGALHVGQTTDAATRYVDVREQYLPSGYSTFSTLQAVSGDSEEVGPFEPALTYNGDIADTAALERWITTTVVPASNRPSGSVPP